MLKQVVLLNVIAILIAGILADLSSTWVLYAVSFGNSPVANMLKTQTLHPGTIWRQTVAFIRPINTQVAFYQAA
ncbi:hypothetical protein BX667DRAFT_490628 [Coemansia mojavensis]|nr:hypothetical protein BX667DRAFT_490628 [Coemansia mojavensis]